MPTISRPGPPERSRLIKATVAASVLALLLAGCGVRAEPPVALSPDEKISTELLPFYSQSVTWKPCIADLRCAKFEVPINWDEPAGETIQISAVLRPANTDKPLGSIVMNPGGPGSSGVDWLRSASDELTTEPLRNSFNLVSFDPRGVGTSSPVQCLSATETDELLYGVSGFELGTEEDLAATRESLKAFASACQQNTGGLLAHVDTVSVARDMDVLRAILGEERLDYLGYSYGSFLGTTYASLFPERVGSFVLDGAIDPTTGPGESVIQQLKGFDAALRSYLADCLASEYCPFEGSVDDAMRTVGELLRAVEYQPVPTESGRDLTIWGAITGLIMPLYADEFWPSLTQAFDELYSADGTTFLALADFYNDRGEEGLYLSNLVESNFAVNCLESRQSASQEDMVLQNKLILEASPMLGRYWQWGGIACEQWPVAAKPRLTDYSAKGAPPILVIGTTGDPATPYADAVSLAERVLASGRLLTYRAEGHTAFGRANSCVDEIVEDFYLSETLPEGELTC